MEIINLTKEEFDELVPLNLRKNTTHTEANFFYMPKCDEKIIKVHRNPVISEKYEVANNLEKFKNENSFEELITPSKILEVDGAFKGFIFPKVSGKNAKVYLKSESCSMQTKIKILKQIGAILEKLKDYEVKYKMAYGDVHSDNFMVENSSLKVYGIDTDSMKILNSPGVTNFYLFFSPWAKELDKYEYNNFGMALPSYQTDIYCFVMMILEIISDSKIVYVMDLYELKIYLDYLSLMGFDSGLLNSIASIFTKNTDNINPLPYLDSLNKVSEKSSLKTFLLK
jgi:hypothetical protein